MVFDLSKPGAKAIRAPRGGGWIVPLNEEGRTALEGYFGEAATPLAPLGDEPGYIVYPWDAGNLAEYLRDEGVAWAVE